ncbi:MAG: hypothetical protein H0U06_01050 [Solirubrobacterales bacterium]|nr:hypothetical protein [Solirubrobacterales bacterium]
MDVSEITAAPELTRWQSTWRYLFAVALGAFVFVGTLIEQYKWDFVALAAVDVVLGAICIVLMRWRRKHPVAVAVIVNALGCFSSASAGAATVATVSLATRRRWREILPVGAIVFVASVIYWEIHPAGEGVQLSVLFSFLFVAAVTATGMYVGARRDLVATLKQRADRAERDQAMRMTQAQSQERARIAREMHDVLAHRLSLVAMHAGALSYRRGLSEAEVAESADVIRTNAHSALTDLREILGVLRTAEAEDAPERPQPTLSDLPLLVDEAASAGLNVRLHNEIGDLTLAPETIGRSAYRMIQESLTNARKHAPDTTVDVALSGAAGEDLLVEVRNPMRVGAGVSATPGAGLGLIGLTERAELIGGSLEHGIVDGSFVMRALLPWPA